MFTSYYANAKSIPPHLKLVGISQGVPKWFSGSVEKRLAPTWPMLKMPREKYDMQFELILDRLDPEELYESLGDNAVLLCYEKPNDWCHRRMVAEWFENELGIVVPEFSLPREKTLPYEQCGRVPLVTKHVKTEKPKSKPDFEQGALF